MGPELINENPNAVNDTSRENLRDLADKARNSEQAQSFMEPGTKAKNKGGRPKGSTNKAKGDANSGAGPAPGADRAQSAHFKTGDVLKMPLAVLSKGAAGWAGHKNAEMKPEELEAAAQSLGMVIDKWMPNLIDKYGPEVMCFLIFSQWGIRVYAVRRTIQDEIRMKTVSKPEANSPQTEPSFDPNSWVPPQKPETPAN